MTIVSMSTTTAPNDDVNLAEHRNSHPLPESSMPSSPTPQSRLIDTLSRSSSDSNSGDSQPRPSPTPSLIRNQSPELLSPTSRNFVSSPLNPSPSPPLFGPKRPNARPNFPRIASEDARALSIHSSRGSMILYRLADAGGDLELPPPIRHGDRKSVTSSSGDSIVSLSSDSKYPSHYNSISERGVIAYAYDPTLDQVDIEDDEFHNPKLEQSSDRMSARGLVNISTLLLMMIGLMALFVIYPVYTITRMDSSDRESSINQCRNGTGQIEESLRGCTPFRVQNVVGDKETTKRDQVPMYELPEEEPLDIVTMLLKSPFDSEGQVLDLAICADDDEILVEVRFRRPGRVYWETALWNDGNWQVSTKATRGYHPETTSNRSARKPHRSSWKYSVLEIHLPLTPEEEVEVDSILVSQRTLRSHAQACDGSRHRRQIIDISDALLS